MSSIKWKAQELIKLDDIQNLSNFNLKVVENVLLKKGGRDYYIENKGHELQGAQARSPLGMPLLLYETSDF